MKVNAPVTMRVDGVFRTAPLCDTNNVRRLEDEKRSRILNLMSKRRDVFPVNALNQWSTKPATCERSFRTDGKPVRYCSIDCSKDIVLVDQILVFGYHDFPTL